VGASGTVPENSQQTASSVELNATRLTFPAPEAVMKPYFGIGPSLRYDFARTESATLVRNTTNLNGVPYTVGTDSKTATWSAGLAARVGLEWVVNSHFALHAEYGETARYGTGRNEQTYENTQYANPSRSTTFDVRTFSLAGAARSGLSVFF
jgi:hypothetical protein